MIRITPETADLGDERQGEVSIALAYPDLLGTYGDGGNATILAQRLRRRGYEATVLPVLAGEPLPTTCDIYVIGGGEDLPQSLAAEQLRADNAMRSAVEGGAVVLAVCAGLQILGTSFVGPDAKRRDGAGLLDCETSVGKGPRAVGEIIVDAEAHGLGSLSGYENHGGVTSLGSDARPVGAVRVGVGNGDGSGVEGAVSGKVWGTYLHGPVLARNSAVADMLLSWVVGPLSELDDHESAGLRAERLEAALAERGGVSLKNRIMSVLTIGR